MKLNFLPCLVFMLGLCKAPTLLADPHQAWQVWRAKYESSLTSHDGWLSLAGLYWLNPGINTLGSAPTNQHRFPQHAPAHVGEIHVDEQTLLLKSALSELTINEQRLSQAVLRIDDPTRVKFGQFEFFLIEREQKLALRLIDHDSPNRRNFVGTRFFPFKHEALITGHLSPHPTPQIIQVATVYGTTRNEQSAGWIEFTIEGETQRLEAVDYGENSPLYLFFSDATSGHTTYPAGRYLQVDRADSNGQIMIDFNRSYNPPCAYTPYATCPLTPPQNRLKVPIIAGELDYSPPNSVK